MGTRNITLVKSKGKIKVAQYGQWDGYPTGQGQTIADFLNSDVDLEDFAKKVDALEEFTAEERNGIVNGNEQYFIGADQDWTKEYPQLNRDVGAGILELIANGTVKKVELDEKFREDGLFCEYWYEIDLDNKTVQMGGRGPADGTYTFDEWKSKGFMQKLEDKEREE